MSRFLSRSFHNCLSNYSYWLILTSLHSYHSFLALWSLFLSFIISSSLFSFDISCVSFSLSNSTSPSSFLFILSCFFSLPFSFYLSIQFPSPSTELTYSLHLSYIFPLHHLLVPPSFYLFLSPTLAIFHPPPLLPPFLFINFLSISSPLFLYLSFFYFLFCIQHLQHHIDRFNVLYNRILNTTDAKLQVYIISLLLHFIPFQCLRPQNHAELRKSIFISSAT